MTEQDTNLTSTFKAVIPFHQLLLSVVERDGADYIPLKPIVDMLGLQWKSARKKAFFGDNQELLGTRELNLPIFDEFSTASGTKKAVFILLEAGETYLMKTNTNQIRDKGNTVTADYLLKLQKEWRKALHDYETHGIAMKDSHGMNIIDAVAKIDRIKNPALKQFAAEKANEKLGLNIALANQGKLDV